MSNPMTACFLVLCRADRATGKDRPAKERIRTTHRQEYWFGAGCCWAGSCMNCKKGREAACQTTQDDMREFMAL